jgi:RNA recognition motif-containing protein
MLKISNANCTVEELHSMFSRYGKIVVNCIRGYAIIKFDDEESAMRAMRCYHNYPLHNKRLVIRPYKGGPVDHDEPLDMEIEQLG